MPIASIKSL